MAREKFQTLTEQMFYTLMCFNEECCGMDVMKKASDITEGRANIGAGTLYNLIEQFAAAGLIQETKSEGRRKNYVLTKAGRRALSDECDRLQNSRRLQTNGTRPMSLTKRRRK